MTKPQERIAVFAFGVFGVLTLLILSVYFPDPSRFQFLVFKIVLALAASGIAVMIPGFIELEIPGWLKAGGALAIFALVMYKNPAVLVAPEPGPVAALNVQVDPDTVGIVAGALTPVTYRFREINGVQVTVDSQDIRWLLDNGDELGNIKNNRILGGSFTVASKGQHDLRDNVFLPRDIARKVIDAGMNQVQLESTFTAVDSGQKRAKAKAVLRIGIMG